MGRERNGPGDGGRRPERGKGKAGFRQRYGVLLRMWAVFLGVLVASLLLLELSGRALWNPIERATARVAAALLSLIGPETPVEGNVIRSPLYALEIVRECTAIQPLAILIAAVLATPTSWRNRWIGLAFGIPALLAVNQLRLVSLVYVGHWRPDLFHTVHEVVWQWLIILATVAIWILWAARHVRRPGPAGA